ncbi:MAG: dihydrolipoamide dehydrogenase [Gammaproteobacteria bacterium]|nr:dihydrolipoamide dehydrogenase [Gammaproteobacteria bacterium]
MSRVDLVVPDIGNAHDVDVVDVLVKPGDVVEIDTPLLTLETDKASLDVPATSAGTIAEVLLKRGDKVSKGAVIARVDTNSQAAAAKSEGASAAADATFAESFDADELERTVTQPILKPPAGALAAASGNGSAGNGAGQPAPRADSGAGASSAGTASPAARSESAGDTVRMPVPDLSRLDRPEAEFNRSTQLLVLGAGPGGYTAAFRAADLGLQVTLVERWPSLGGVCLNVGCIPSKALLHAAKVIEDADAMSEHGISFGAPAIDLERLRAWKGSVVKKLTGGLRVLAKQRKVDVVQGAGRFVSPNVLEVMGNSGSERIRFDQCIIAAGSEAIRLPGLPADQRIMDSTDALELPEFSGKLLVVGGGIIGLEMACVYDALGSKVSVVELTSQLMPGCDPDLVRPLERRIRARYEQILLGTKVAKVESLPEGLRVTFEGEKAPAPQVFDRVLVAVGRVPNGKAIGADVAGVKVSERGFIPVDKQMRTNVPHIFAIGDIASMPMLAHKAMHEAKVAAEVAAGEKRAFDARAIPSVAYTDPEIAWVGLTETEAKANGIAFKKGSFPWVASGRSLSIGRDEGLTKLLFDPETHRVLGGGIVGTNAGELISEVALAVETGCDAADVGLTIHPHPTLSETVAAAADAFEGTLTDLFIPKK